MSPGEAVEVYAFDFKWNIFFVLSMSDLEKWKPSLFSGNCIEWEHVCAAFTVVLKAIYYSVFLWFGLIVKDFQCTSMLFQEHGGNLPWNMDQTCFQWQ